MLVPRKTDLFFYLTMGYAIGFSAVTTKLDIKRGTNILKPFIFMYTHCNAKT